MNWVQAKRAAETLEDVYTEEGDAVVIGQLSQLGWMAKVTGHGPDCLFEEWIPITRLTAKEDI